VALGQCQPVRSTDRSPGHAGDLTGEEERVMILLLPSNRAGFCAEHLTQADVPLSPYHDILAFLYLSAPDIRRQRMGGSACDSCSLRDRGRARGSVPAC
jgi:hypothetical protein